MSQQATENTPLVPEHVNLNNSSAHYASLSSPSGLFQDYVRPVLCEVVGTMLFVCVGVMCVQYAAGVDRSPAAVVLCAAVGHGLTIAALITALGDISGAHVNPAVTLALGLAEAIPPAKALLYVPAQLAGALMGAGLTKVILPPDVYRAIGGGAHTLGEGVRPGEGVLCEVVLTTLLVLTILVSVADPLTKSPLAPVAVGFIVIVNILAGASISGASMNPARSFGPAVLISAETSDFWTYHYVYWVGPLLGSLVAAICYRLLLASGEKRLVFRS